MEIFGAVQVALVGVANDPAFAGLERIVAGQYVPSLVLAAGEPGPQRNPRLLADKPMIDGKATAYVCRGYVCDAPTTDPATLSAQLSVAGKVAVNV
jgi:uncharacterized protein YyaL (SSP411 family)